MRDYKMMQLDSQLGISQEVKEVERKFFDWLKWSRITEEEFLKLRTVSGFAIKETERDDNFCDVKIGYGSNEFKQIGLEFVVEKNEVEDFMTLALMLLYMSNKLDNANEVAPVFEQRKGYFTKIVKSFIKENDKFKLLNL